MRLALKTISASELATVTDCEARLFHDRQRYRDGLLSTDRVPADLSLVVHDAIMEVHRSLESRLRNGNLPPVDDVHKRLRAEISKGLFLRRLSLSDPAVAGRLKQIEAGLDRAAEMILDDAPGWASDPANGDALVWVEGPQDHGPEVPAVEVAPGRLVKTRPDLIGLRLLESGKHRAVVRDFKARNQVTRPESDYGILVRGPWVLAEARAPRCQWFIANRQIEVDLGAVDLEIVNMMHAGTDEFLVRASLSESGLSALGEHVVATLDRAEIG
jgi:hypothetical protein